jgi:hypothetical protein
VCVWLCVHRSERGGSFRNDQDVQKGDGIIRPDVYSKFDVCPQVLKDYDKHVMGISVIFSHSECAVCTINP